MRTWRPLHDDAALRSLGCRTPDDAEIADWLGFIQALDRGPVLIRAGRAARDWLNRAGVEPHNPASYFAAACLWREETAHSQIPLPVWSAPELYHHRLGLRIGLDWMAQFLECVTAAALTGLRELARLLEAEKMRADIGLTARSRLPDALDAVLRAPVVTANSLAKTFACDAARSARSPTAIHRHGNRAGSDGTSILASVYGGVSAILNS